MTSLFADDIFNLADIALDVSRRDPERIAVIEPAGRNPDGSRRYRSRTYRELSSDVEATAVGLRDIGIAERTRTVFMAPPSYAACVAGLALTRVGATTVWIDPSVGYRNVAERLRRLDIEAFVGIQLAQLARMCFGWGPRFLTKAVVLDGHGFAGAHSLASLRRPAPAAPRAPAVGPHDAAAIMYTTGSTGPAKPALYPHRNMCNIFRLVHRTWRFDQHGGVPVDMPVFPAFFTVGLSAGGTVVVPPIDYVRQGPADVDPRALLEVIRDCRVQTLFASPVILENLARLAREGATAPSLHTVVGGGAPLYADVIEPLREMIGGEVHADYGATECLPATEMAGREALAETYAATARGAGLCVGRPFPGVELRIIAIVDGPIATLADAHPLGRGEIGEIIVRGPHVSPAYADDPASTKRNKLGDADGAVWHRLGDAGYLDAQGRVWCCGRVGHRIELATGPLFPLLCEPIFDAHPRVRRSGLVGVSTPAGLVPVICVELVDGATRGGDLAALRDELLALAAAHPTTRQIRRVLFHSRLPVDPRHNSKIERPALARWAARRLGNPRGLDMFKPRTRALYTTIVALLASLAACATEPELASNDDELTLVSSGGITVTASRWISARTIEADISTPLVSPAAINGPHRIRITLPSFYAQNPTARYPVVYLLHGGAGGNSAQWTTGGGAAEAISVGKPVIVVMPDGGKVGWFTNWVDQSKGAQAWADFYLTQVIPWVDVNFRSVPTRQGRAIAGLSMGGYGAVRLAQDRPDLFASVASFSGAVDLGDLGTRTVVTEQSIQNGLPAYGAFGSPFWPSDTVWNAEDPMQRPAQLAGLQILLYAGAGINDVDVLERTMGQSADRFSKTLDASGIPHFWWMYGRPGPGAPYGCDGGHNFSCWNFAFDDALPRMLGVLQVPAIPPPAPGADVVANGGFEAGRATWECVGTCDADVGAGWSRSGAGNGWVRSTAGWNDLHQTIPVAPGRTYVVTGWIRTSANNTAGYFGLRTTAGQVLGEHKFASFAGYTQLTVTVNAGNHTSLDVYAGLWANGDTWLQLDDVSVVGL